MMWAAYDRKRLWRFDFYSETDDKDEALEEAQEEDSEVTLVIRLKQEYE